MFPLIKYEQILNESCSYEVVSLVNTVLADLETDHFCLSLPRTLPWCSLSLILFPSLSFLPFWHISPIFPLPPPPLIPLFISLFFYFFFFPLFIALFSFYLPSSLFYYLPLFPSLSISFFPLSSSLSPSLSLSHFLPPCPVRASLPSLFYFLYFFISFIFRYNECVIFMSTQLCSD